MSQMDVSHRERDRPKRHPAGITTPSKTAALATIRLTWSLISRLLRVFQLVQEGRLPAQKIGRDYVIDSADLKLVKNRKPGRPRTKKSAEKKEVTHSNARSSSIGVTE